MVHKHGLEGDLFVKLLILYQKKNRDRKMFRMRMIRGKLPVRHSPNEHEQLLGWKKRNEKNASIVSKFIFLSF